MHRSWEMAAILDFLDLFRIDLKLDRSFTAHELESVIIFSPGGEGLLGSVHTVRCCPQLCNFEGGDAWIALHIPPVSLRDDFSHRLKSSKHDRVGTRGVVFACVLLMLLASSP